MTRGQNFDELVRYLNPLMCIDMGTTEVLFNSNTDNEIKLVKSYKSHIAIYEDVCIVFWCPHIFLCIFDVDYYTFV